MRCCEIVLEISRLNSRFLCANVQTQMVVFYLNTV